MTDSTKNGHVMCKTLQTMRLTRRDWTVMNTSLYPLTCPLCPEKLESVGRDGELVVLRCAKHGNVNLSADGRIWVDELPELTPQQIALARARAWHARSSAFRSPR